MTLETRDTATPSILLPEGARLVHIGPPKTGTTSLQSAFHVGRAEVEAQGVHYVGANRQPMKAVLAVAGIPDPLTGKVPGIGAWRSIVGDVRGADAKRSVLSSEYLSRAKPDAIRTIMADLDPTRVQVVVTLRPLARILTSQWQQNVQNGLTASLDAWLHSIFDRPHGKLAANLWLRHRHDELVARWAEVVGPGKMTVIALDDGDHSMVLRVFERLVGLRDGTLAAVPDLQNRSMTLQEIELVRAFNELYRAQGLDAPLRTRIMTRGAGAYMKRRPPGPEEPRIGLPPWAIERAEEVAREMIDAIVASGVRLVGDPEGLVSPKIRARAQDDALEVLIPPDIAATAAFGVLVASGLARGAERPADADEASSWSSLGPIQVAHVSTSRLASVLVRRIRAAGGARVRAAMRRIRR